MGKVISLTKIDHFCFRLTVSLNTYITKIKTLKEVVYTQVSGLIEIKQPNKRITSFF